MKKITKSCGACRYWKAGFCTAPLPISLAGWRLAGWLIRRKPTLSTDGFDCKAFRKKIVRQARLKLVSDAAINAE